MSVPSSLGPARCHASQALAPGGRVVEVLSASVDQCRSGDPFDPGCHFWQYWSKDGVLLADSDTGTFDMPPEERGPALLRLTHALNAARAQLMVDERPASASAGLIGPRCGGAGSLDDFLSNPSGEGDEPASKPVVINFAAPLMVRLVEVIEVQADVGAGTSEDPRRRVTQYWSKEGALLADTDDGGLGLPVGRCGAWLMRLHAQLQAARAELVTLRAEGGASC